MENDLDIVKRIFETLNAIESTLLAVRAVREMVYSQRRAEIEKNSAVFEPDFDAFILSKSQLSLYLGTHAGENFFDKSRDSGYSLPQLIQTEYGVPCDALRRLSLDDTSDAEIWTLLGDDLIFPQSPERHCLANAIVVLLAEAVKPQIFNVPAYFLAVKRAETLRLAEIFMKFYKAEVEHEDLSENQPEKLEDVVIHRISSRHSRIIQIANIFDPVRKLEEFKPVETPHIFDTVTQFLHPLVVRHINNRAFQKLASFISGEDIDSLKQGVVVPFRRPRLH